MRLRRHQAHYDVTVMILSIAAPPERTSAMLESTHKPFLSENYIWKNVIWSWWRHEIETFPALLALCAGNAPVIGESPLRGQWRGALMFSSIWALNKRLSKQSRGWWFKPPSRSLWHHWQWLPIFFNNTCCLSRKMSRVLPPDGEVHQYTILDIFRSRRLLIFSMMMAYIW